MCPVSDSIEKVPYNEFGMFHENAEEYGLPYSGTPTVRRESVSMEDGRTLSALVWGSESPRIVFLHGGAQNVHTWDTVVMALGTATSTFDALCIDLPGHGHSASSAPFDVNAGPLEQNARDIAAVISALAPNAELVVGMSLGGLTSIALSRVAPDLVRRLCLVDITPGVDREKTKQITDFVNGPATFPSFEELLKRTIEFNPTRSVSSLRRGILHNALQLDDGSWVWRYRRDDAPSLPVGDDGQQIRPDNGSLWDAISEFKKPLMFVRGMRKQSVVSDSDEEELLRRAPHSRVEHVQEAGHSVQGDTPLELAELLRSFISA